MRTRIIRTPIKIAAISAVPTVRSRCRASKLWTNQVKRSWFEPFKVEISVAPDADPLRLQIQQFCRVIRGEESRSSPVVKGY